MIGEFEFNCVYGTGYYYDGWYVVHGGCNVNYTPDDIDPNGVTDVEELYDTDCYTSARPINSLEELVRFIDDDEDDFDDEEEEEEEDVVMTEEECNYFSGLLYGVDNNQ